MNLPKRIKIKYHDENMPRLTRNETQDWIDLRASERYELTQGDYCLINLGVSMQIPKGYEAHILPRSSTFKNYGLLQCNGQGIVDNKYSGDADVWMMPVYATRDTVIEQYDRICQFRIIEKMPEVIFDEVETLGNNARGGFGTSGVK